MFVWRLLIKPVAFLDHLEGSKRLFGLIVVVELPRQVGDREKEYCQAGDEPKSALAGENCLRRADLNHERRLSQVLQKVTKETKILRSRSA